MLPLEVYYLRQAGRGSGQNDTGIGPIYSTTPYLRRGHGIGNVFGSLFPWIKPIFWSGAKALGRETLRTGDKILRDIAENRSPEERPGDIISRHVTKSTQTLLNKLRGRVRKRVRRGTVSRKKAEN